MTTPLVSVSMITYNQELFIGRAIEGVLQQKTNFPFELVIGEDCSTDRTREIVLGYRNKYPDIIRVIMPDNNLGMIINQYRTDKATFGKYVAWCDGDDYWHNQNKLQRQVDYMESHPSCGLVHSDYNRYFVSSGRTIYNFNKVLNNVPPDNLDVSSILRGGEFLYILTCTVITRQNLLFEILEADPILYQTNKFSLEDTSRYAEIASRSKTHYIDESLATYNVLPDSASKFTDPIKQMEFAKSNNEFFLYLVEKYHLPDSEFDFHKKNWCRDAMVLAFYLENKELAREVMKYKGYLSLKEHILYYGALNNLLNRLMKISINIKNTVF